MAGFSINIDDSSFKRCLNVLKVVKNDLSKQIDDELNASVQSMATLAKQKAPADNGRLRGSIVSLKVQFLSYQLKANTNYAAYVEFGTGQKYKNYKSLLDNEWRDIASKYFVTGKGFTNPQPFFYPSVKQEKVKLYKNLQNILTNK